MASTLDWSQCRQWKVFPAKSAAHGWEELTNGALIDAAEQAGFEIMA
jgi:hypothetical protein